MTDESQNEGGSMQNDAGQISSMPKDAQVISSILKDMGVTDYEPRVVNQLLEFAYRYITDVFEDAKVYSAHAGNSAIIKEDVKFTIQTKLDQTFTSPPPRDFLVDVARQKNGTALPSLKTYSGARLPSDRYCLTSLNFRLKHGQAPQRRNVRQGSSITASGIAFQSGSRMPMSQQQQAVSSKRKWQGDYDDYDT